MTNDLDDLDKKIRAAKEGSAPNPAKERGHGGDGNMRAGLQAGMEFSAAILFGCLIGYGIDRWLGTQPAFFLILFFFGVITGFYNVYRVTQNAGSAVGISRLHPAQKGAKTAPDSDESGSNNKG